MRTGVVSSDSLKTSFVLGVNAAKQWRLGMVITSIPPIPTRTGGGVRNVMLMFCHRFAFSAKVWTFMSASKDGQFIWDLQIKCLILQKIFYLEFL